MKRIFVLPVLAGLALLSVACAKEPTEAVTAANSALAAAKTAEAADYAPAALAAAETAAAALDAELKAQSEKFALTRSYTKAAELATAAKAAADKAAAEAVTGKEQMKTEATTLVAGVRSAVEAAKQALAKAPKGKGSAADLEAMKSDVAGVETSLADMDAAIAHCTKGAGIWQWASNDQGAEPDVVMASCGDVPTLEALAATALLRQHLPGVKVRFVNVLDLFKLVPHSEHPHGLTDREFEALFTPDRPVVLNFHGYPWLIHRLTYRRPGQHHIHVRGYKEQGNINTPLELAIRNQSDRFSLAIDAIDRMPRFRVTGAGAREALLDQQIACKQHAYEFGTDPDDINNWEWPF
jgi:hypothetical protein